MATNYPGSLDTGTEQPSPLASTELDDAGFEHDVVHTNHSEAIIALETKVGTGSSTAVADSVLAGTGAGTSAWTTGALANDISGNAATATALETARTINGTSFDGTANITVTAAAGTLTGSTLNSGVTASSLTSVGTLTSLDISGDLSFGTPANGSRQVRLYETGSAGYGIGTDVNRVTIFASNSSTYAERMVIDSNGNVGINDTSPSYKLDVNGTGGFMDRLFVQANGSDILRLRDTGGTDTGGYIAFEQSGGTRMGYIGWGNNDDIHIRNENSGGNMFFGVQAGWAAYFNTNMDFVPYTDSNHELGSSSLRWQKAWFDTVDIADDLYIGANGRGDSWSHFYDDNSNTWRTFGWDDSANSFYFEGNIQVGSGTSSAPSLSFASDGNTGFYRVSDGVIGVVCNGVLHQFKTDGLHLASGDWFRSYGSAGWYNGTYGGGWYMTDSSWIKAYNNKGVSTGGTYLGVNLSTSTGSGYNYLFRNSTYATFYYYTSTREVKENIVNVDPADSGVWIDALQPVEFIEKWLKDEEEPPENKAWREADVQIGFIAEDVLDNPLTSRFAQVKDGGDGNLQATGWKWECVIAASVAEIKALRARVAALEAA